MFGGRGMLCLLLDPTGFKAEASAISGLIIPATPRRTPGCHRYFAASWNPSSLCSHVQERQERKCRSVSVGRQVSSDVCRRSARKIRARWTALVGWRPSGEIPEAATPGPERLRDGGSGDNEGILFTVLQGQGGRLFGRLLNSQRWTHLQHHQRTYSCSKAEGELNGYFGTSLAGQPWAGDKFVPLFSWQMIMALTIHYLGVGCCCSIRAAARSGKP